MMLFKRLPIGRTLRRITCLLLQIMMTRGIVDAATFGCYPPSNPMVMTMAPAGYDVSVGGASPCSEACRRDGYLYAGVTSEVSTSMTYCRCSASLPTSTQLADSQCTGMCMDGQASCGEGGTLSVYEVPQVMYDISMTVPFANAVVGALEIKTDYDFTLEVPGNYCTKIDFGEGAGLENANNPATNKYLTNGCFMVSATVLDTTCSVELGGTSLGVCVESPVGTFTIQCLEITVTHDPVMCNVTVPAGTSMSVTIDYSDGLIETLNIADASVSAVGPGIPGGPPLTAGAPTVAGSTYLIEESICGITTDSKIEQLQFYAHSTGTLQLLVMEWTSCDCHACAADTMLLPYGACGTSGTKRDRATWIQTQASAGMIIKSVSTAITVNSVGRTLHELGTPLDVNKCEFLAWYATAGLTLATTSGGSSYSFTNGPPTASVSTITASLTVGGSLPLIRAVISKQSLIHITHTYVTSGVFPLRVNVSNLVLGSSKDSVVNLDIIEGINETVISNPMYEIRYKDVKFIIEPHTGSNVSYDWTFSDGSNTVTYVPFLTRTFSTVGDYTVTVTASNSVSSKQNVSSITIEDALEGLSVTALAGGKTGQPHHFNFSMTAGTNFLCYWNFDDGSNADVTNETTTPITGTSWTHEFLLEKTNNVNVTCENHINSQSVGLQVHTLAVIADLKVDTVCALKGMPFNIFFSLVGTNPEISLSLDSVDYPKPVYDSITKEGRTVDSITMNTAGNFPVVLRAQNAFSQDEIRVNLTVESQSVGKHVCKAATFTSTTTDTPVDFPVQVGEGTSVAVSWDYQDGTTDNHSIPFLQEWPAGQFETRSHSFTSPGCYNVLVTMSNCYNNVTCEHTVSVTNGSTAMTFNKNEPILFSISSKDQKPAIVSFSTQGCIPENTEVSLDWGDGEITPRAPYTQGNEFQNKYTDSGTYPLSATFYYRSGGVEVFNSSFQVVQLMSNLQLFPKPEHAVADKAMNICVSLDSGDGVTLKIDYDSASSETRLRNAKTPFEEDCFEHTYTTVGEVRVVVTATNGGGTISKNYILSVQKEVIGECYTLSQSPVYVEHPAPVSLTLSASGQVGCETPTDASVNVYAGDGNVLPSEPLTFKTWSLTFSVPGEYPCYIEIINLASSAKIYTTNKKCLALSPITDLSAVPKYKPLLPIDGPPQDGFGPDKDIFPLDKDVIIVRTVTGTVSSYTAAAIHEDQSLIKICEINGDEELKFTLPKIGKYEVNVTATNPIGSLSTSFTVMMIESPENITITDNNACLQSAPTEDATIEVRTAAVGVNSTYKVTFGDGAEEIYGNAENCFRQNDPVLGPWGEMMSLKHAYAKEGRYGVEVCACGPVLQDPVCTSGCVIVSGSSCTQPNIQIVDHAPNFYQPREVHKCEQFFVKSDITLDKCQDDLENSKSWKIEQINATTGEVIQDVTLTGVPAGYSTITIPPRQLELGLYRFTITVTLSLTESYTSSESTYIEVTGCPLIASLVQGVESHSTVGCQEDIVFEPLKHSYDPDILDPATRAEGITCEVRCSRIIRSQVSDACPASNLDQTKGCFKNQAPGLLSINSDCTLSFNTKTMRENETYQFQLTITKGERTTRNCYSITVSCADIPPVSICFWENECTRIPGGLKARSPTNGLRFRRCCPASGCDNELMYNWRFLYRGRGESIIEDRRLDKYLIGADSPEVNVDNEIFVHFPVSYDGIYRFQIQVTATNANGARAEAYIDIEMNKPPSPGSCSISPKNGTQGEDRFKVSCSGWSDTDGLARMSLLATYTKQSTLPTVHSTVLTLGVPEIYQWSGTLPSGVSSKPEVRESKVTVKVIVEDLLGGTTHYHIDDVMIYAPDLTSAEGEALLVEMKKKKQDAFDKAVKEGNLDLSLQLGKDMANKLDTISYAYSSLPNCNGCNNDEDPKEIMRSDVALAREKLITASKSFPVSSDPSVLELQLTTLNQVIQPNEITLDSQSTVIDFVKQASEKIKSLPLTKEELIPLAEPLLQAISSTWKGTRVYMSQTLICDKERATRSDAYKIDNSFQSSQGVWDDLDKDQAAVLFMDDTITRIHDGKLETELTGSTMTSFENVAEALIEATVAGEEPTVIETPETFFKVAVNTAEKMMNSTFEVSKGIAITIPQIGNISSVDNIASVQVVMSCNPFVKNISVAINAPIFIQDLYRNNIKMNVENLDPPIVIDFDEKEDGSCSGEEKPASETAMTTIEPTNDTANTTTVRTNYYNCTDLQKCFQNIAVPQGYRAVSLTFEPDDKSVYFKVVARRKKFTGEFYKTGQPKYVWKVVDRKFFDPLNGTGDNSYQWNVRTRSAEILYVKVVQCAAGDRCKNKVTITSGYILHSTVLSCVTRDNKGATPWEYIPARKGRRGVKCECPHLSAFGGGFAVQPNTIDWEYVFANLDFFKNITLYVTEIVILIIYVMAAVWARRADRKDVEQLGLTPLKDNKPEDKYLYEVHVVTGKRRNAGTDSNAFIILSGEYDESDVHRIQVAGKKKLLKRGADDGLILSTPRPLGDLNYLRVWHDNSGKGKFASWMLKHITIQDLQTKHKFFFICDKWLAVEKEDGQVDRVLPVAGPEQLTEFSHLFSHNSRKNLSDDHLWYSVVARPPESRFTRLQRVSCCLLLLYTNMLANALFYDRVKGTSTNAVTLGPFALSLEQLYVGMITNLIIFPINFLVVQLFRKSPLRSKRKSRVVEALKNHDLEVGSSKSGSMAELTERPTAISPTPRSATGIEIQTVSHNPPPTKNPKKKGFQIPWWSKIVAWILLWAGVLASAVVVTALGIMFGDYQCKKWISSMVISFATSILFTQPLQVLLFAVLFSIMFKKPSLGSEEIEEDEEDLTLQQDEEWQVPDPEEGYFDARPRTIAYSPPNPKRLTAAREARIKELKMYDVIREIIFYCVFLWLLLVLSYSFRPSSGYRQKAEVKKFFIDQGLSKVHTFPYNFMKVTSHRQFWDWLNNTYLPAILATTWYNGDWLPATRGYLKDRANRIMGFSTLRQLRSKQNGCRAPDYMKSIISECNNEYSMWDQEEGNYGAGWRHLYSNETADPHYIYRQGSEINSYPIWGRHGVYSGGGYVVNLEGDMSNMQSIVDKLREDLWIDKYTRAVFIEFTTYNPGVNLFSIVTITAEFVASGGIFPRFRVEPINLLSYYEPTAGFEIFCQVAYAAFILFFLIKEFRNVHREGKQYFTRFWNWVEMVIIILSITGAGIFAYRFIVASDLTNKFKETKGQGYIKFQYVGYWQETLLYVVGFLVFCANLKFLKLLRFNRRISMLAATLRVGARPLLMFSIMFSFTFGAHVQFFYFVYFKHLNNFKTLIHSAETCVQMMLGRFNFNAMSVASPYLGSLGFFVYVLFCAFILLNMFVSILNESFTLVRIDVSLQSNDYEMVDYMVHRFKCFIGAEAPGKSPMMPDEADDSGDEGAEQGETKAVKPERLVEKFPERVDRLLTFINKKIFFENLRDKVYYDQERLEDVLGIGSGSSSSGKAALSKLQSKEDMRHALAKMLIASKADPGDLRAVQQDFDNI